MTSVIDSAYRWQPLVISTLTILLFSLPCFADKNLPLVQSTCGPLPAGTTLACLWNDHQGCFIRASKTSGANATCGQNPDGRATLEDESPDGTQITLSMCAPSVTVNDFCDTILAPIPPFETTFITLNPPPPNNCDPTTDLQCIGSPIIVDTTGEGFQLTSAENGVTFDIRGDGHPVHIAWTEGRSRNAFLALDRNHNGKIDDGTELFGNFTQQPKSQSPNGFLALADFDKPENGGNGDGIIDERDAVFSHLLLWIDENHDGISQANELHSLPELGVFALDLNYKESRKSDEFGNLFRFKTKVNPSDRKDQIEIGRWAYDVFLTIQK